ncbi:hypothetical protein RhiirA1_397436 [Rhizophagus irregularis]|uniref:Uncharacterized protein n=1 Tax=Rhizophagus irregularis TaxID=588596 RepID=A0A2N0RHA0_9GLOM|nr:hypothetical protein RhiirA1_397436 [Rhizophagus irregularis]
MLTETKTRTGPCKIREFSPWSLNELHRIRNKTAATSRSTIITHHHVIKKEKLGRERASKGGATDGCHNGCVDHFKSVELQRLMLEIALHGKPPPCITTLKGHLKYALKMTVPNQMNPKASQGPFKTAFLVSKVKTTKRFIKFRVIIKGYIADIVCMMMRFGSKKRAA